VSVAVGGPFEVYGDAHARIGLTDFIEGPRNHMAYVPQALVRTQRHGGGTVAEPVPCRASLYLAAHAGRVYGLPGKEHPGMTVYSQA
jgi:hypothetical protein